MSLRVFIFFRQGASIRGRDQNMEAQSFPTNHEASIYNNVFFLSTNETSDEVVDEEEMDAE